ncbi:hypothetical protein COCON_G00101900 [Conger conger]|uniref:Uncharacterized protein n=1 Tax=Conger conger TaxID=82655 RepID=A0A9Q1HXG5_CONCO|nr:hypothetical protein COCON_G00101900 [Conger conger]
MIPAVNAAVNAAADVRGPGGRGSSGNRVRDAGPCSCPLLEGPPGAEAQCHHPVPTAQCPHVSDVGVLPNGLTLTSTHDPMHVAMSVNGLINPSSVSRGVRSARGVCSGLIEGSIRHGASGRASQSRSADAVSAAGGADTCQHLRGTEKNPPSLLPTLIQQNRLDPDQATALRGGDGFTAGSRRVKEQPFQGLNLELVTHGALQLSEDSRAHLLKGRFTRAGGGGGAGAPQPGHNEAPPPTLPSSQWDGGEHSGRGGAFRRKCSDRNCPARPEGRGRRRCPRGTEPAAAQGRSLRSGAEQGEVTNATARTGERESLIGGRLAARDPHPHPHRHRPAQRAASPRLSGYRTAFRPVSRLTFTFTFEKKCRRELAEVRLKRGSDLGSAPPSAADPDTPRIPTVTLTSHRRMSDRRLAHRVPPARSRFSFRATRTGPGACFLSGSSCGGSLGTAVGVITPTPPHPTPPPLPYQHTHQAAMRNCHPTGLRAPQLQRWSKQRN